MFLKKSKQEGSLDTQIAKYALNKEPLSFGHISDWSFQLISAIEYLHDTANIVHRDIKPANIFIATNRELALGDLGHAKNMFAAATRSKTLTRTNKYGGANFGTNNYLPPEIIKGDLNHAKSKTIDIWY